MYGCSHVKYMQAPNFRTNRHSTFYTFQVCSLPEAVLDHNMQLLELQLRAGCLVDALSRTSVVPTWSDSKSNDDDWWFPNAMEVAESLKI